MESVRRAQVADIDRCVELVEAANRAAQDMRGGLQLADMGSSSIPRKAADVVSARELVTNWAGEDETSTLLVGTYESVIVGLCAGVVNGTTTKAGRIECCYVEEPLRGVGVGAALVEGIVAWFKKMRCSDLDALALPGDRATKQIFESAGFKARLLVLHRALD